MPPASTRFRYSLLLREIDNLRAEPGVSAVALVLIQLDGLDEVNLKFGYVAGDKVLEEFAARLAEVARQQDRTFEINGTAFALLIRNPLHEGHAVLGAEKVARVAADPVVIGGGRCRVRPRMGISLLPAPAASAEELLRQCELALAEARGRDEAYAVYTPALARPRGGPAWFDVEEALARAEFELHYQPKLDLKTGRLAGAEALVRWQHPQRGLLLPAQFLPAVEGHGSMRSFLWFALNAALRQSADWMARRPGFSVAVNVSPANLADPDLLGLVEDALRIWTVPDRHLVLEITETALMRDPGAGARLLGELRDAGVRVSLDDFGTGYSSLAYLRNLPADELKIDKSFVQAMGTSDTDRRIVDSVVQLGHAVNLAVVAEGIEDEDACIALAEMGCDLGQGYFFGRPAPAAEFAARWFEPAGLGSRT